MIAKSHHIYYIPLILIVLLFTYTENSDACVAPIGMMTPLAVNESPRMIGYWDLRDRKTHFQVTNTSGQDIKIHIQIFDVDQSPTSANTCFEFNYFDTLTPFDTHVYDVSELDRNDGSDFSPPDFDGGHGIIAVTHVNQNNSFNSDQVLTGNFRIIDSAGYEYRSNFAGSTGFAQDPSAVMDARFQFNNVNDTEFSDLIIISVNYTDTPGGIRPVGQIYDVTVFDQFENPISCPGIALGCGTPSGGGPANTQPFIKHINVGVNQKLTNSRGGPSVCSGTDPIGFVEISAGEVNFNPQGYFYFIGLNNGIDTGSMTHGISTVERFPVR